MVCQAMGEIGVNSLQNGRNKQEISGQIFRQPVIPHGRNWRVKRDHRNWKKISFPIEKIQQESPTWEKLTGNLFQRGKKLQDISFPQGRNSQKISCFQRGKNYQEISFPSGKNSHDISFQGNQFSTWENCTGNQFPSLKT